MEYPPCVKSYQRIDTLIEFSALISQIIHSLVLRLSTERSIHKTALYARNIIESKYQTPLTVESVAKEIFVSPNYLSTLFKQELGIKFVDYLHEYRINQAKKLFKEDKDIKIYEVAKEIGYNDEKHFSKMFKKWTGVTPTDYSNADWE